MRSRAPRLCRLIESELISDVALALWKGKKSQFEKRVDEDLSLLKGLHTSLHLTLSHLAAIRGNWKALVFLKERGESFTSADRNHFLPCHYAAFHSDPRVRGFFRLFEETAVEGTISLTPLMIRRLTTPSVDRYTSQNCWTPDALCFSMSPFSGLMNASLQEELEEFERRRDPLLCVQRNLKVGLNVVANETIAENTMIGTYDGEVSIGGMRVSAYAFGDFFKSRLGDLVIDGIQYGSLGCLFNDSAPNIFREIFVDKRNGLPRMVFKSLRTIQKGEAITWDYGALHLTKNCFHVEFQESFLREFFEGLLHRVSSEEFCRFVLSDRYKDSLDTRREVEVALYLDGTLSSLAWAAASGIAQKCHLTWILTVASRHKKPVAPSFCRLVSHWLEVSTEEERGLLLNLLAVCDRQELINFLLRRPSTYRRKIKEFVLRRCMDALNFIAHQRKSYVAKFSLKYLRRRARF